MQAPEFPFLPRSARSLLPGMFWDVPLSNGTFAAGCVVELDPRARVSFLAALLDWDGPRRPTVETIRRARSLEQGDMHVIGIRSCGGQVRGRRPAPKPWLFRGATFWRGAWVQRGLVPVRPQEPADTRLPVFSTWGYDVLRGLAEARFVERKPPPPHFGGAAELRALVREMLASSGKGPTGPNASSTDARPRRRQRRSRR